MTPDLARMSEGTRTLLVAGGQNLSRGQRQRLLIARAIVGRPRLLIVDEAFIAIDEMTRQRILDAIYADTNPWTIVSITHIDEVVMRSTTVHILSEGRIVETGSPEQLVRQHDSALAALFPYLSRQIAPDETK